MQSAKMIISTKIKHKIFNCDHQNSIYTLTNQANASPFKLFHYSWIAKQLEWLGLNPYTFSLLIVLEFLFVSVQLFSLDSVTQSAHFYFTFDLIGLIAKTILYGIHYI